MVFFHKNDEDLTDELFQLGTSIGYCEENIGFKYNEDRETEDSP
ncbi:MAG: hypothetical protein ACK4M9_00935 [Anaerobacillus sp.]